MEFVEIDFPFLLGEEAQDRCDYQKFMADCPFVNFFPFDKYLLGPRTVVGARFKKVGKASGWLPYYRKCFLTIAICPI